MHYIAHCTVFEGAVQFRPAPISDNSDYSDAVFSRRRLKSPAAPRHLTRLVNRPSGRTAAALWRQERGRRIVACRAAKTEGRAGLVSKSLFTRPILALRERRRDPRPDQSDYLENHRLRRGGFGCAQGLKRRPPIPSPADARGGRSG